MGARSPAGGIPGALAFSVLLLACKSPEPIVVAPRPAAHGDTQSEFPDEPHALLRYHSTRFNLRIPLPDGHAWRIDDHKTSALVALHPPTHSTLTLESFSEPEVMNRRKCEERAREMGLFVLHDPHTLEDITTVGPDAYDSRIWVVLDSGGSREPAASPAPALAPLPAPALSGHVFLFGAFVRKCLFAHFVTEVPSEKDEPLLTSRLAVARLRIFAGIEIVPFDQPPRSPIDVKGDVKGAP